MAGNDDGLISSPRYANNMSKYLLEPNLSQKFGTLIFVYFVNTQWESTLRIN